MDDVKPGDLVRVRQGSFETPDWFEVQDGPDGLMVTVDESDLLLGSEADVVEHKTVPITVTVELPRETSWSFLNGAGSISPDPAGALVVLGPVQGVIDDIDIERAAKTLLAILERRKHT